MIKSMTGYGRHREVIGGRDILCEIRTVNSKYLDLNIKMPRVYNPLEDSVKKFVTSRLSRGKTDIYISVEKFGGDDGGLSVNEAFLNTYVSLLRDIKERYQLGGDVTIQSVAARGEVFLQTKPEENTDELRESLLYVVGRAIDGCTEMRAVEGKKLYDDLLGHISVLEGMHGFISGRAPVAVKENNERMKERIRELLSGANYDESRLLTECAVFADKADISEELARLGSHFVQFKQILTANEPVGRKLDFLTQELNREVNTIGSKANDSEITRTVLDAKATIERIREQVQNIE